MERSVGATVAAVSGRLILDSHLGWTPEFDISVEGGQTGRGSAPRGETLSVFEAPQVEARDAVFAEAAARLEGGTFTQVSFDAAAVDLGRRWGTQVTMALSIAFHLAAADGAARSPASPPRLLLNLLNGGMHAYTNPVKADAHEFMLIARSHDLTDVANAYIGLLGAVRARLRHVPLVDVGGNAVHALGEAPDEAALTLLRDLIRVEGVESLFGIAVDASAGDWRAPEGYHQPVSGRRFSTEELTRWWLDLVDEFAIDLLEDPFAEEDRSGWRDLHARRPGSCRILGDNYTSTNPEQLTAQGKGADVDGVLAKPNQNGTVSGTLEFAAIARESGLMVVASHRSVETESTALINLSREMQADAIKIGPFRDFTAVVKFNELLRTASA